MGVVVTTQSKTPTLVCALRTTIGRTYRRQSEPHKFYIAVRGNDKDGNVTNEPLLVSLEHGNRVTTNLGVPDFIEVKLQATATDVL